MSFVSTGGVSKWSQITIDADKNMLGFGMSNLKQVAAAMVAGDIIARGLGGVLVRIPAGFAPNLFLTTAGPGALPYWGPGGLYLNRYIPATISLTSTRTLNPTRTYARNNAMPISSVLVDVLGDDVAHGVKMLSPAVTMPSARTLNPARDHAQALTPALHTHYDLQKVVDGAIADDGGVLTDETAAAQSAAANDMHLLPAAPVIGDAYDFGSFRQFDVMGLTIGTPGVGAGWTITWKYWNGAWNNLAGVVDNTTNFQAAAGIREVSFTRPGDWVAVAISGITCYWIRGELTAFTNIVTQPLGTTAYCRETT